MIDSPQLRVLRRIRPHRDAVDQDRLIDVEKHRKFAPQIADVANLQNRGFGELPLNIQVEILYIRRAEILADGKHTERRSGSGGAEDRHAGREDYVLTERV